MGERASPQRPPRPLAAASCASCARPAAAVLALLWLLNVADLLLTTHALRLGVAEEANRLMAFFLEAGPLPAAAFKIGLVTAGVLVLWLLRRHRTTLVMASLAAGFYAVVVAYQVVQLALVT